MTAGNRRAPAVQEPVEYFDLKEPVYMLPPEQRTTTRAAVMSRPFGYLAIALVWWILAVIGVLVAVAALPWRLGSIEGGLGSAPGFTGGNMIFGPLTLLFIAPLFAALCGVIVSVPIGLALTATTLFTRSLRPSYRAEKLAFTVMSTGAEASGPASLFGMRTAFSLNPVRLTRWVKLVKILAAQGLVVNFQLFVNGTPWGIFYFFTVMWMLWPAEGAAVAVCAAFSVLLFAWFVWVAWRNRHKYPNNMPEILRGTAYEHSWPNRPVEKSSPKPSGRS